MLIYDFLGFDYSPELGYYGFWLGRSTRDGVTNAALLQIDWQVGLYSSCMIFGYTLWNTELKYEEEKDEEDSRGDS